MFGLTKREQRWKAEQQAVEVVLGLVGTIVRAAADARIAEAQADADELARLRAPTASPVVHPAGERTASSEGPREAHAGYRALPDDKDGALKRARAEGMEYAAKLCDRRVMGDNNREDEEAKRCADAIRAAIGEMT